VLKVKVIQFIFFQVIFKANIYCLEGRYVRFADIIIL